MIRALDIWLPGYLRTPRRLVGKDGVTDVVLAICDHFEPHHDTDHHGALERVGRWQREYPKLVRAFRDADGNTPRHTFFYPIEQYDPEVLERLSGLCRETGSEIEVHLHHENDTDTGLREKLEQGKAQFRRHGALAQDAGGAVRFGFIHGDWALGNSHPKGRHCGVPHELSVLADAGCYGDFTMPSAPDRTQARTVNQIYYATNAPGSRPHDWGDRATVGRTHAQGSLPLVPGPLGLNWRQRKLGFLPRIENSELSGVNPPTPDRLALWLHAGIHVAGRPEWLFIKLHSHGGTPQNMSTLLGEAMPRFYAHLLEICARNRGFRLHFVTAREMVNIIHAAEEGCTGDAGCHRNHRYRFGPA